MPRTGRPRGFDKEQAIERAMLLVWERGFAATTLADLKLAMNVASPTSFYAAFGSKDALMVAVVARYLATHGRVMSALHDPMLPPRTAIEKALRDTVEMQTDPRHPTGCLVALSAASGPASEGSLGRMLAAERRRNAFAIVGCVERAIAAGELRSDVDATGFAAMIDAAMAGISLRARDGIGREVLERAVDAVLVSWDAMRP